VCARCYCSRMVTRLAAAVLTVALLSPVPAGAANPGCITPQGWPLFLGGTLDPDPIAVASARAFGGGSLFEHVMLTRASVSWFSIALENPDTTLRWPAGQTVCAVTLAGRTVPALELYAVTPAGDGVRLTGGCVSPADAFERRRFRGVGVCTVLFAGFPGQLTADSLAAVRVGRTFPLHPAR
jgi:hypothetical protein